MANVKTYSLKGKATKERVALPTQFETPYRPDVIKRAVLAVQSRRYQPHGVDELAGKRNTICSWDRWRQSRTSSRVKESYY
jgi:large subunit ribosomal protein L4e